MSSSRQYSYLTKKTKSCCFSMFNSRQFSHLYKKIASCSVNILNCRHCSHKSVKAKPPWNVLFFGTDDFSLKILESLNENRLSSSKVVNRLDVVTVDSLKGDNINKMVPVREYSKQNNLNILDWKPKIPSSIYDVGILASFGHMVPKSFINIFPYGILNVHPSLLPRWRGAMPIEYTILHGDQETGISIMDIQPEHFDTGSILMQSKFEVPYRVTAPELRQILADKGANLMIETLQNLPELKSNRKEQSSDGITHARLPSVQMFNIDWENQTWQDIDCQSRAFQGKHPGRKLTDPDKKLIYDPLQNTDRQQQYLVCKMKNKQVKLSETIDMSKLNQDEAFLNYVRRCFKVESDEISPGSVLCSRHDKALMVKCKNGWIGFKKIKVNRPYTAVEFDAGFIQGNRELKFTGSPNGIQFNE